MAESLFSQQVVQPYLNDFPHFKEAHDDRLFKHITFHEKDEDLKLRLTVVDNHGIARNQTSRVTQKVVPTKLEIVDPSDEVFRVKAVLSKQDHGLSESHWVTSKHVEPDYATTHNQYRIHGVSKEGWKGDWVYSELRDEENDLIVYNMIYDVLDLLLTVHDDQVDFLMDYVVSDTFKQVLREMTPEFARSLEFDEVQVHSVQELMEMLATKSTHNPQEEMVSKIGENFMALADELKKDFKENIMSSPKEFSELLRVYKCVDQYREKQVDFVQLLIEIFLEERYEDIVKNADIEVILQNDEESGIYLNGRYEFDIKGELITAIYNASPDDHFVTSLNDAVELISEPVVFEKLTYDYDEEFAQFIRIALRELYVPMLAIDRHLLELKTDLEDEHMSDTMASIVEFDIIGDEGESIKHLLMFDVIEAIIKGDMDPDNQTYTDFIDHMLNLTNDAKKHVLVEHFSDEVLEVFLNMGESFRQSYTKEVFTRNESQSISLADTVSSHETIPTRSFKDSYRTIMNELHNCISLTDYKNIKENQETGIIDLMVQEFNKFKHAVQESIRTATAEDAQNRTVMMPQILAEGVPFTQGELVQDKLTNPTAGLQTDMPLLQDDAYYNLFKHNLRTPHRFPLIDRKYVEVQHNLRDFYLIEGEEKVHYALGEMGDGWPISVFKVGTNTLKGEVSTS